MGLLHDFVDAEDLSALDAALWSSLLARALPQAASGTSWPDWPGDGWMPRCAALVGVERGAAGAPEYVIDSEADWRDRIIMAVVLVARPSEWGGSFEGPVYPGNPNDTLTSPADGAVDSNAITIGYTGSGLAVASGETAHPYQLTTDGGILRIYADSSDGVLRAYRHSGDADINPASYFIVLLASEQLGERSTPGTHPSLAVVDGTQIEPHILNGFQDRSMLGQVREAVTPESDAFPLGPKLTHGGFPERWTRTTSPLIGALPRRQPVAGMTLRCFVSSPAAGAEVVLDDSIDWRDRFVWASGRYSANLIGPGQPNETSHNTASAFNTARYTGTGSSGAMTDEGYGLVISSGELQIRARSTDGALVLRNETAGQRTVTAIVAASFQLGPRAS